MIAPRANLGGFLGALLEASREFHADAVEFSSHLS
jgi:hypothetical protein